MYVILLTSNSRTEDVVEGLNAGADDYITKPFQPEELQVRMRAGERILSLESRDLTIFALAKLAERDPQSAGLAKLRMFAGLSSEEAASIVGLAPRSAIRRWSYARAWLIRQIQGS